MLVSLVRVMVSEVEEARDSLCSRCGGCAARTCERLLEVE
jgi:hypothetical protein